MNQQQRNYAERRIKAIAEHVLTKTKADRFIPGVKLNGRQRYDLIADGIAPLRSELGRAENYTRICDVFDFSAHESKDSYQEGTEDLLQAIRDDRDKVLDEIMLGDALAALAQIKAFADRYALQKG